MQDKVQTISELELDVDSLWRVDDELLTIEQVKTENLSNYTPIGYWLPVVVGAGCYCYFTDKQKAVEALKVEIEEKIQELKDHLNSLN